MELLLNSGGQADMTRIDEIVDGIYRISTMPKEYPVSFNQFLIDDEHPALSHTGMAPIY
jgi:hypothetical protein